ncbi:hypothetical protein JXJ21_01810 [candidate division KSB1 bacterium]|nr:hypothetical protein [candidate division KSB1 bacterium]
MNAHKFIPIIFMLLFETSYAAEEIDYAQYFTPNMLRIDLHHGAIQGKEFFAIDGISAGGRFAGSKKHLLGGLNLGQYQVRVFDAETNIMIFSRGYSSIFQEWFGLPGSKTVNRVFEETFLIPCPRAKIILTLCGRDGSNQFQPIFTAPVDPGDALIFKEHAIGDIETTDILISGAVEDKLDIAILAEGYTKNEQHKFKKDAQRVMKAFFEHEPFSRYKSQFNFRSVCAISLQSGTDLPEQGIFKATAMDAQFYSLRISRYLTVPRVKKIFGYAARVPFDYIIVLVNSARYGGAGFYNLYCTVAADNANWQDILQHEFGHLFAGLADEYEAASLNIYSAEVEPWETNITTNAVPEQLKWRHLVADSVPLPTPDSLEYDHTIAGMWEGAGYASAGIWRPAFTCRMRENSANGFCPVCRETIERIIRWYSR